MRHPVTEEDKKKRSRRHALETAMRALPLREGADCNIASFVSVFESTFYAVERQRKCKPATEHRVDKELKTLSRLSNNLARHIEGMHTDSIIACASAGESVDNRNVNLVVAINWRIVDMPPVLVSVAELAIRSLEASRRAKRAGRHPDAMAKALRDTAAFAYERLTPRRAGRVYNAISDRERESEFSHFLEAVYAAYGVTASAMSRARRRPSAKNSD
jgi:hypothetical protein